MTDDIRKTVLLLTIGLCDAILDGAISVDDAQRLLFSPRTMTLFEDDPTVKNIIHRATEFEDLLRLIPHTLDEAVAGARRDALAALKQSLPCGYESELRINDVRFSG